MRVKRGVTSHAKHQKIRQATKGMSHSRRRSYKMGKQAVIRSLQYAYRDRRTKKRTTRTLWNTRINAAAREHGTTYSRLINSMAKNKISLNRKIMADLAVNEPKVFEAVVKKSFKS